MRTGSWEPAFITARAWIGSWTGKPGSIGQIEREEGGRYTKEIEIRVGLKHTF